MTPRRSASTGRRRSRGASGGDLALAAKLLGQSAAAHQRAGSPANAGIATFKRALVELRAGQVVSAVDDAAAAVTRCPAGNIRAFALDVLALALAERGSPDEAREAVVEAWLIVEREALVDRLEALESAVAVLGAEGRYAEALGALSVADRERPRTGWVRDPHVAVVLERWRADLTRSLTSVHAGLAAAASSSLTVESAMAGAMTPLSWCSRKPTRPRACAMA